MKLQFPFGYIINSQLQFIENNIFTFIALGSRVSINTISTCPINKVTVSTLAILRTRKWAILSISPWPWTSCSWKKNMKDYFSSCLKCFFKKQTIYFCFLCEYESSALCTKYLKHYLFFNYCNVFFGCMKHHIVHCPFTYIKKGVNAL